VRFRLRSRWKASGGEDRSRIRTNPGVFARLRSFAFNILKANRTDTLSQDRYRAGLVGIKELLRISWLRVSGTAEMPQIDQRVGHQLHPVVPRLFELEAQQQPLEFVLPREGPLHA
jgi:hypothetical protein